MTSFKLATWNVNSIRTRQQAVLSWLEKNRPDVLCVQETKVTDDLFPRDPFREAGYECIVTGQKTYNGVAILTRHPFSDPSIDFPGNPDPAQKRYIAATIGGIRVLNVYVPNGSEVDSPSFFYKLAFIAAVQRYLSRHHDPGTPLALAGDFNVAPEPRDVYDPAALEGEILFHPKEREALRTLNAWGLTDLFRLHHDEAGQYTWWDYRMNAFRRKMGLRIDHVWATPPLAGRCVGCSLDREPRTREKPSDHIPVIAEFAQ